jgi:hypothetical protein
MIARCVTTLLSRLLSGEAPDNPRRMLLFSFRLDRAVFRQA